MLMLATMWPPLPLPDLMSANPHHFCIVNFWHCTLLSNPTFHLTSSPRETANTLVRRLPGSVFGKQTEHLPGATRQRQLGCGVASHDRKKGPGIR